MADKKNNRCAVCQIMRAMAFSGAGGGLGAILASLLGGDKQDAMTAAVVMAAVFVLAFANPRR